MPKIPLPQRAERQPETGITVTPNRPNIGTELPTSSSGLSQSLGQLGKLFDKIAADKRAQDDLNLINRHKLDTAIRLDNLVNSEKQFQAEEAQGAEKRFLSNAARDRQRLISKLPEHLQQEASMEYDALLEIKRQSVINYENEQRKLAIKNNLTNSLAYYQNIVNEDPLQFEKAMEDIDEELDYLEMANAYSPSQIEILKRDRKDKVGYTAVNAMIVNAKDSDTPEVVYDAIEANLKDTAGTFKEFVTEETREKLLQKVRDERKAWKNDQRLIKDRLEKDVEEARTKALRAEVASIYNDIEQVSESETANVADWIGLKRKMRSMNELGKPENAKKRLDLDDFIEGMAKGEEPDKLNDINKEKELHDRADAINEETSQDTINTILDDIWDSFGKGAKGGISRTVRDDLLSKVEKFQKSELKGENNSIKNAVRYGKKMIIQSSGSSIKFEEDENGNLRIVTDAKPDAIKRTYEFEAALNQKLEEGKTNGKDVVNMLTPGHPDNILDSILQRHLKPYSEQVKDLSNDIQGLSESENTINNSFDPEGSGFDLKNSRESEDEGIFNEEDKSWHLGSIDPRTGMILKGRKHETWDLMIKAEKRRGSKIVKVGSRYYSFHPDRKGAKLFLKANELPESEKNIELAIKKLKDAKY